jgi:hypothetical protein
MGTAKKKRSERYYLNSRCRLAAVFVDEFGDEEDVMGAREDGEREDSGVNGRKVITGAVRDAGGENDQADGEDLYGGVDFAQQRGTEAAEAGDDVDGGRADEDEHVAADNCHCHPKRYRQMRRQRLWKNGPHRQNDKRRDQHQLIRDRVQNSAELRFLIEATRQQAVEAVCDSGGNKDCEGEYEALIEK